MGTPGRACHSLAGRPDVADEDFTLSEHRSAQAVASTPGRGPPVGASGECRAGRVPSTSGPGGQSAAAFAHLPCPLEPAAIGFVVAGVALRGEDSGLPPPLSASAATTAPPTMTAAQSVSASE